MKLTFAVSPFSQPSQETVTVSPYLISGSSGSGAKKRNFRFCGGSSATTGRPAGTVSPGR